MFFFGLIFLFGINENVVEGRCPLPLPVDRQRSEGAGRETERSILEIIVLFNEKRG